LPAGSSLKFVFPDDSNETTFALAWLEIPAFWNGEIAIPLILYDVSSNNAEVYFQHENVINNRGLLTNKIADSKEFDSKLVIKNNKSGVRIRYYINPKLYAPEKNNTVTIWGTIKGVTITTEKYSHGEKQDWRYICDDHYIQLVTNITSCFQQKTLNIASLDDYLENVEFVLGCDAVKQFNYDETLIRSLIDKKVRQVKNSDTIFWQRFSDINEFSKSLSDIIYESQKYDKF